jgi:LPS O-antigen subunit length determinant protein (WzzB/FepE family)
MEFDETLPPEKIAFIAYNIGVYESVQKFGQLIMNGKITSNTDASKVAELLSESIAFYDAEMISGLINTMLRHTNNNTINKVSTDEVRNIMNQLKAVGVSIP